MRQLNIEEIKSIQLQILDTIDEFCNNNNIKYFLGGGSLLGAIRHHGYIPWDDDIDIMMLRGDYDKFVHSFGLNGKYRILAPELNIQFPYPFAKVEDTSTVLTENMAIHWDLGVNIDVFPIETIPESEKEQRKLYNEAKRLYTLYSFKKSNFPNRGKFVQFLGKVLHIVLKIFPIDYLNKRLISTARMFENAKSSLCGVVVWGYGIKEIHPSTDLDSAIDKKFEDREYKCPVGYDSYLRAIYGNYMELPPVEKRVTHHDFKAYLKD